MIPTNIRNIQIAKKKAKRKRKVVTPTRELSKKQKEYLETVAEQRIKELFWREQRIILGLPWACGFDRHGEIYPIKRSTA